MNEYNPKAANTALSLGKSTSDQWKRPEMRRVLPHHDVIILFYDFIISTDSYRQRTKHDINSMEIEFLTEATALMKVSVFV